MPLISQIYFWNKTLHVSDSSSVSHQEFFHFTHSNGICHTGLLTARNLSANLYDIYHCCMCSEKTPDDGQRNCPKNVEFYSKNKFEKLLLLVGFIIRVYHDARSPERQIRQSLVVFHLIQSYVELSLIPYLEHHLG